MSIGKLVIGPAGKIASFDMLSNPAHQALIEPQVVDGGQNRPQHFADVEEVANGGPWEMPAGVTVAILLNGA